MRNRLCANLALVPALALSAHAGSVDNRNNNSAEYIRDLSRNAAVAGADASIYNPAGTVLLDDGLTISVSNQTVAKYNEHDLTPTANSGPVAYKSDLVSPFYPTAFAVYKRGEWSGFAAFSFPGGGGELDYEKGSATTFPLQTNLQTQKLNADAYLRSLYFGFTLGGAYAFKPWVSASLAARTIYARTDISVDAGKDFPPGNTSKLIDHMEEARGYSGVAGLDFFPLPELTLALRYEAAVPLEWEVQRSRLNLEGVIKDQTTRQGYVNQLRASLREPGTKFDRDLPAVLGLGAGYRFAPWLRASLSMNVYFNSQADWDGKEDKHDDGYEYAGGLEYASQRIPLKLSLSGQYTITGADQASYQIENPALDSYSFGLGGRYGIGPKLGITLGWTGNFAIDDQADFPPFPPADLKKHVLVYALGLDYHLF
jgi:long-subunit fatty acid transport protein